MAGVGVLLSWFGYSVFYHGLNTITGGNDSFVSLIWPGKYTPTPRDGPNPGADNSSVLGVKSSTLKKIATDNPVGAISIGIANKLRKIL